MKDQIRSRADISGRIPEVKLREYWLILLSHKWVVSAVIIFILAASILYLQMVTPIYQAETTLIREEDFSIAALSSGGGGLRSLIRSSVGSMERKQALFRSRWIVDEVVKQMAADGSSVDSSEARTQISLKPVTSAADMLRITATSDSPTEAMKLANVAADVYISKMSELRSTDLDQAESFLSEQRELLDDKLRQAEEALNAFREREGIIGLYKEEGSPGLLGQLGDLHAELAKTQNDRELAQAKLMATRQLLDEKRREATSLGNNRLASQIESLRSLITSWQVELVALRQTLTDRSREVINLKQKISAAQTQLDSYFQELKQHGVSIDPLSEWQSLVQESVQLEIQLKGLEQNENLLKARIAKFKADHPQLISKEIELGRLERSARIHEQTYMLLTDKYEGARLLRHMRTAGITVIERATEPESPIEPNKRSTMTFGILMAIIMGVGTAFFLEHLDNSLRIEKDVDRFLACPLWA